MLTAEHLYVRLPGRARESARVARTDVVSRWNADGDTCFVLRGGATLAFPTRGGDELHRVLDDEVSQRADAPCIGRQLMFGRIRSGLAASGYIVMSVVKDMAGSLAGVTAVVVVVVLAAWMTDNRVLVDADGLTLLVGRTPRYRRFVPRDDIARVVVQIHETFFNPRVEVSIATGAGKEYVIVRHATKEPLESFAKRHVLPEARRIAEMLGLGEPMRRP